MSDIFTRIIKKEEGWRESPYYCSEGYPTIGYGFKIGNKGGCLPSFSISKRVGEVWLEELIQDTYDKVSFRIKHLDSVRAAVIVSMAFQMGTVGLYKFKRMWKAIEASDWEQATREMLDSRWAKQAPERAKRHATMMLTGELEPYYGSE